MSRDIQEHDFYVALLSSDSITSFPNNTLSSFTNKLTKPCAFNNSDWLVGVCELGITDIKKSGKLTKHEWSEYTGSSEDLQSSPSPPPLKKALLTSLKELEITIENTMYKIIINESILNNICYNKKKKDLNFV